MFELSRSGTSGRMIDDQHHDGSSVSVRKVKKRIAYWFIIFVNIASSAVVCPLELLSH